MRVLIFGDVHGNLLALEKMLAIEKNEVDRFVCHGDILNYGPFSEECLDLLTSLPNCELLKGNHEAYFEKGMYPGDHPIAKAFFEFCYPRFNQNKINTIQNFAKSVRIGDNMVQHTLGERYIFQDTPLDDIIIDQDYIIGHSHQQYERFQNDKRLVNTGSLGQNRAFINKSDYLILDTATNSIQFKSFIFSFDNLINEMKNQKYPDICLNYYRYKKQV